MKKLAVFLAAILLFAAFLPAERITACVIQLVEQGKIELNAPVSRYFPDARDGDRITVRQLLNHTGGLGEHQNLTNYKIVNEQGKHVYANVNYALLGKSSRRRAEVLMLSSARCSLQRRCGWRKRSCPIYGLPTFYRLRCCLRAGCIKSRSCCLAECCNLTAIGILRLRALRYAQNDSIT